jgi:hypothetical protein
MDSIKTILQNKNFNQPDFINDIKKYILDNYQEDSLVQIGKKTIKIYVKSSALANTLRLHQIEMIEKLSIIDFSLIFLTKNDLQI